MINCSKGTSIFRPFERTQVVDPILQRNDPTVEEFGRIDPLSAEVVNQQTAAVAFELQ